MLIFFRFVLDQFLSTGECCHDNLTFSFYVSKQITIPLVFFEPVITKYSKTSSKKRHFHIWKTKNENFGDWKKTENLFTFLKLFLKYRKWTKINVQFSFLKKSFKSFFSCFFVFLFWDIKWIYKIISGNIRMYQKTQQSIRKNAIFWTFFHFFWILDILKNKKKLWNGPKKRASALFLYFCPGESINGKWFF